MRSRLMVLVLAVLTMTGTARADIVTQSRLDEMRWGTPSTHALLEPLVLKWDRWMHTAVADVAACKAIAAADRYHGMVVLVVSGADSAPHLYGFHGTSTTANDNDKVVAPTAGSGRWLRLDDIVDGAVTLADLGANGCTANQIIKRNSGGTAWACAADLDTAGSYLPLSGGTMTGAIIPVRGSGVDDDANDSVTLNKQSGLVTTKALTAAPKTAYTLTVVDSYCTSSSVPVVANLTRLGSNSTGTPVLMTVTPGSGSFVLVTDNINDDASFNGTLVFSFAIQ